MGGVMATRVEEIAEQVKALPDDEREELLSWLADFEIGHSDDWDKELARDSQPGGRLEGVLERVRKDIAEGRTKPLDEILDNS
jgi:DNA-binding transcriptional ArsR family regulator